MNSQLLTAQLEDNQQKANKPKQHIKNEKISGPAKKMTETTTMYFTENNLK